VQHAEDVVALVGGHPRAEDAFYFIVWDAAAGEVSDLDGSLALGEALLGRDDILVG
jgi:hypothetical protein